MACVADRLIASPFATLGSIGVVALAPNAYERLQREGIQVDDVTAGKYKRTLTPYRKWNAADKASMQKDVDAIHEIFKGFVKHYRPQIKINEVATGQVSELH
jgi:serine protease SohB